MIFWLLYVLTMRRWWYLGLLGIALVFVPSADAVYHYVYEWLPRFGVELASTSLNDWEAFYYRMLHKYYLVILMAGMLLAICRYIQATQRRIAALKLLLLEKEESKNMEINFLTAQINPHFLFNMLNVFYGEAKEKSAALGERLLMLARLMRYQLDKKMYQCKLVDLERELEALQLYLALERSRFPMAIINLRVGVLWDDFMVPPLALITLVENAFKHGRYRDGKSTIDISLSVDDSALCFRIANDVDRHGRVAHGGGGLGLENLRRRLELVFGKGFSLDICEEGERHEVQMRIQR